jgi:hypothetical protein
LLLKTKYFSLAFALSLPLLLTACDKKEGGEHPITVAVDTLDLRNEPLAMRNAKSLLGNEVILVRNGNFKEDSVQAVAAGLEYSQQKMIGIKFAFLKKSNGRLEKDFQTALLNGSFEQSTVKTMKMKSLKYDLLYYNSRDYFMGSQGGEVYSYLIDFNLNKVYYAHFITVSKMPFRLYLSPNIDNEEIKKFFIDLFKKDFPATKLIKKDQDIDKIF